MTINAKKIGKHVQPAKRFFRVLFNPKRITVPLSTTLRNVGGKGTTILPIFRVRGPFGAQVTAYAQQLSRSSKRRRDLDS